MIPFLVVGAAGVLLLVATLLLGDILESLNHFEFLGSGWFSTASLAGFIGALGFVGAIVLGTTGQMVGAIGAGIIAGLAVGAGVGWATRMLRDHGEGSAPNTNTLIGRQALVISAIPADGYGEVRLQTGSKIKLNASSDAPVPEGTRVWVSDVRSATAVTVRPVDELGTLDAA